MSELIEAAERAELLEVARNEVAEVPVRWSAVAPEELKNLLAKELMLRAA